MRKEQLDASCELIINFSSYFEFECCLEQERGGDGHRVYATYAEL